VALESDTDLEKSSEFDVAVGDSDVVSEETSGSEVVLLEDEGDAPKARSKTKSGKAKKALDEADVDLADEETADEDASASKALKGVKGRRDEDEDEAEVAPVPVGAYRPVPWGPLPVLFLFPALIFMLIGGLMAFELVQTMWGYQQPRKPAAPLVRELAKTLDMELKDQ
jgi:hypothetical protein